MGGDCLFCRIIRGELNSQKVYEDELAFAFKDLNPVAPTHLLVIPKKHIPSLAASEPGDDQILGHLQGVIRRLAVEAKLDSGYRVVINNGRAAGQSVDHVHYHVLGGRRLTWPPG